MLIICGNDNFQFDVVTKIENLILIIHLSIIQIL